MSNFYQDIGIFFISDGVFLLLPNQNPKNILQKNFVSTFGILSLYDINSIYICKESAIERGLQTSVDMVLKVHWISYNSFREKLSEYNIIITF